MNPTDSQQLRLGLVCITASQAVRYRTITRKRLLQLSPAEQKDRLRSLYAENIQRLKGAIEFCLKHQIYLYRLNGGVFPFCDVELGESILAEFQEELRQIGDRAINSGVRLVMHPPQFVVLNSDSPQVVANSRKILAAHALILDYLGQERSPWAALNIHGGKGNRREQLVQQIAALPTAVRSRLTLENDESTYSAQAILDICQAASVPMVFDAHHHVVCEDLDSYDHESVGEMLAAARFTWPDHQLVHISNGRTHLNDPQHSDFIEVMPSSYVNAPWIEVEAKKKELAIEKLRQEWQPLKSD
ncbi:MAG: UV damage endonuclease UvsE [Cyanophyceae cyanobacterium]